MHKETFSIGNQGILLKCIKATKCSSINKVADHQLDEVKGLSPEKMALREKENNEKIEILPSSDGFPATKEGFRAFMGSIAAAAIGTKIRNPLLQIVVSPSPYNPQLMTQNDIEYINKEILVALNLSEQASMCIIHTKKRDVTVDGETPIHWHLNISLVKANGRAANVHNNVYKLRKLQKRLEKEYGLHITSANTTSTQRHDIGAQNRRLKINNTKLAQNIRDGWRTTTSCEDFKKAMSALNLVVQKGNLTPIVLHNPINGATYSLKNILGNTVRSETVRARFSEVEYSTLPEAKVSGRKTSIRMKNKMARIEAKKFDRSIRGNQQINSTNTQPSKIATKLITPHPPLKKAEQAQVSSPQLTPDLTQTPIKKDRTRALITQTDSADIQAISQKYQARIDQSHPDYIELLEKQRDAEIAGAISAQATIIEGNQLAIDAAKNENHWLDQEEQRETKKIEAEKAEYKKYAKKMPTRRITPLSP